jgi:hypothetical protein
MKPKESQRCFEVFSVAKIEKCFHSMVLLKLLLLLFFKHWGYSQCCFFNSGDKMFWEEKGNYISF